MIALRDMIKPIEIPSHPYDWQFRKIGHEIGDMLHDDPLPLDQAKALGWIATEAVVRLRADCRARLRDEGSVSLAVRVGSSEVVFLVDAWGRVFFEGDSLPAGEVLQVLSEIQWWAHAGISPGLDCLWASSTLSWVLDEEIFGYDDYEPKDASFSFFEGEDLDLSFGKLDSRGAMCRSHLWYWSPQTRDGDRTRRKRLIAKLKKLRRRSARET